jgi:uncharacterized protein YjdB
MSIMKLIALVFVTLVSLSGCGNKDGALFVLDGGSVLQVEPSSAGLNTGETQQFSAYLTEEDGTRQDVSDVTTWSSSDATIASISSTGLASAIATGNVSITASYSGLKTSSQLEVFDRTLTALELSPAQSASYVGLSQQYIATAVYSDGRRIEVTSQAAFASSDTAVAEVANQGSAVGLVSSLSTGSANITTEFSGQSATATHTVSSLSVTGFVVTPFSDDILIGMTRQYKATARLSDGSIEDISDRVLWASNAENVASVDANGLATGIAQGESEIQVSFNNGSELLSANGKLSVKSISVGVQSIDVTPSTADILKGTSQQFSATLTMTDSSTTDVSDSVAWSSSNTNTAIIDGTGVAVGVENGTATITATFDYQGINYQDNAALTVDNPALDELLITPSLTETIIGASVNFRATAKMVGGLELDITNDVTWSSSAEGIASINDQGVASALAEGTATLTASIDYQGVTETASALFTVLPASITINTIVVEPFNKVLVEGDNQTYKAIAYLSNNERVDVTDNVAWFSNNESVANIDATANAVALSTGSTTISAQLSYQGSVVDSERAALNVISAVTVDRILVFPRDETLIVGETKQYAAFVIYTDLTTTDITNSVAWSSDNAGATISAGGLVTGVTISSVSITASYTENGSTYTNSAVLSVISPSLIAIQIEPANLSLPSGASQQYTATAYYSDGSVTDVSTNATWSSSNAASVSISTTGLASFATPGSATISATLSGTTATTNATSTAATVDSVSIDPRTVSLPSGNTVQLTATAYFSDNTSAELNSGVAWNSSDSNIATVSSTGLVTTLAPGGVQITANFGGQQGISDITVTSAVLTNLQITPNPSSVAVGNQTVLVCTAYYSNGDTVDVTADATWAALNPTIASIDKGLVAGRSEGQTTAACAYAGRIARSEINVTAATLTSIQVTPTNIELPIGLTQSYQARAFYSDNTSQDISALAAWQSDTLSVATINASGLASAIGLGNSTIRAAYLGQTGQTNLTVTQPTLNSIEISPSATRKAEGNVEQFTARAFYSGGSSSDVTQVVSWSSDNATIVDVVANGNRGGFATMLSSGAATITASLNGQSDTSAVTVTAATLDRLVVSPPFNTIASGLSTAFKAIGIYSDNSTNNLTNSVNWQSADLSVATVNDQGLSTGQDVGKTQISATATSPTGNVSASSELTVTNATPTDLRIVPQSSSGPAGSYLQLQALMDLSDGSTLDVTALSSWQSLDPNIAIAQNDAGQEGAVLLLAQGNTTVVATYNGGSATASIAVSAATIQALKVAPINRSTPAGTAIQFRAFAIYSDNTSVLVTAQSTWQSSQKTIASISPDGLAQALAVGTTIITASFNGQSAQTNLTVLAPVLDSILIAPSAVSQPVRTTEQFTASAVYSDGTTADITNVTTWSSSNEFIVNIAPFGEQGGLASFNNIGAVTITANYQSESATAAAEATLPNLVEIKVSPFLSSLAEGLTLQYAALGEYSNGTQLDLTNIVSWSSGRNEVASINDKGLATGNSAGFSSITASFNGTSDRAFVRVLPPTLQSLQIFPGELAGPVGNSAPLELRAFYSDDSDRDVTEEATWLSDNEAIATVIPSSSNAGLVQFQGAGVASITAYFAGNSSAINVTVNPATLSSIEISPLNASVAVGQTIQYEAVGTFSDGSTSPINDDVFWQSSSPTLATITSSGIAEGVALGTPTIRVHSGSIPTTGGPAIVQTTNLTVTPAVIVGIEVSPLSNELYAGAQEQYRAIASYSDFTTKDITNSSSWASSDKTVASVNSSGLDIGLVTAIDQGTANITASYQGIEGQASLSVIEDVVLSVDIVATTSSIPEKSLTQWQAYANLSNGDRLDVTRSANWSSSAPSVALVFKGIIDAVSPGTTTLTANYEGQADSAILTVVSTALNSIIVSPDDANVEPNGTVRYRAIGSYADGSFGLITGEVVWSTANSAVAEISNTSTQKGLLTGIAAGGTTVTATLDGISETVPVTVVGGAVDNIIVTPATSTYSAGSTILYQAFARYGGDLVEITNRVAWSSSDTGVIAISNATDLKGVAEAIDVGSATITASDPVTLETGTAAITVEQRCDDISDALAIELQPLSPQVDVGDTIQFTAVAIDSSNCRTSLVKNNKLTWFSNHPNIAEVFPNQKGIYTGLSVGTASVGAEFENNNGTLRANTMLDVNP